MKKLHPLHTPEFLYHQMQHTGCYPDPERCTGRTTQNAIAVILMALMSPHRPIKVTDHQPLHYNHKEVLLRAQDYARAMGLEHLVFNAANLTITFTR